MRNLNLLVLRCGDIDACRRFYEVFGFVFETHRHGEGPLHHASEGGGGVLELYPVAAGRSTDATGLGFAVGSLEQTSAKLAELGFAPGAVKQNPWGTTFVVRDPDARRVEVSQV